MPVYDLTAEQLHAVRGPSAPEPSDFDQFRDETLEQVRSRPLDIRFTPEETALVTVNTFDGSFAGWLSG